MSQHLLEVFVVVDVFSLCRVLESVAAYVLPYGIDDVGPLGSVDTKKAGKFAGQLILDRLCVCNNNISVKKKIG